MDSSSGGGDPTITGGGGGIGDGVSANPNQPVSRDHMSTQARLRQAKKDRAKQLKEYQRREKEEMGRAKKRKVPAPGDTRNVDYKVKFISSIVLLEAAARCDIEEVSALLAPRGGIDPNSCNEDGLTALHQCCIDHYPDMMRLLVEKGADVNAQDSELWTPLHAAATCNHLDLVQFLIEKGADLLAVNSDGNMPYDICEDSQDKTLDFIENAMAARGITQAMIDAKRAQPQQMMLRDLRESVERGFSVNLPRDEDLATPLHIAAANGYVEVVEYLLGVCGAEVGLRDRDGWMPVHAAACWCHADIIHLLIQYDADVHALTNNYESAVDLCDDEELKNNMVTWQQQHKERPKPKPVKSPQQLSAGDQDPNAGSAAGSQSTPLGFSNARNNSIRRSYQYGSLRSSVRRASMREKNDRKKKDMINEARVHVNESAAAAAAAGHSDHPSPTVDEPDHIVVANDVVHHGMSPKHASGPPPPQINGSPPHRPSPKSNAAPPVGLGNAPVLPPIRNHSNFTTTAAPPAPYLDGRGGVPSAMQPGAAGAHDVMNNSGTTQLRSRWEEQPPPAGTLAELKQARARERQNPPPPAAPVRELQQSPKLGGGDNRRVPLGSRASNPPASYKAAASHDDMDASLPVAAAAAPAYPRNAGSELTNQMRAQSNPNLTSDKKKNKNHSGKCKVM